MRSGGSTCAPAVPGAYVPYAVVNLRYRAPAVPGAYVPYVVVNLRYVWWHMAGVVRANSGAA